ncbi:hypothetical protein FEM33_15025 [Dyadobacter flavalbus]|uniref:PD-(D/E)XK nuclease family protein n=1 Tax=Dyadobacter flavalbus TaxID=2579942 RepID=A0A5M8QRR4_9BACT|nr:PD-(D/E)XK nuclease family protein [Dyadobacter flavalbus]KAA6438947.1 hypothetical protein FEM33_15025 [Dyadobacter flavalbus]
MIQKITPNIFRLATKELTQDSFFVWLLLWADQAHSAIDPALNRAAQDFVKLLVGQSGDYKVLNVNAGRQLQNIDLWAEVNDEYFICIEDKTNTGAHSGQLSRYKEFILERYNGKPHILRFVYLKTGNESTATLNLIREQDGYTVIDRKAVLQILNSHQVNNNIFNDFCAYLSALEELTTSYASFDIVNNEMSAAEGFYVELQQLIPEWTDWKYVSNPTGGFLGFWYHWVKAESFELYIQIENRLKSDIRVTIKISGLDLKIETLNQVCSEVRLLGLEYGLDIVRPKKYRLGKTSTLAIVDNAVPQTINHLIDMPQLLLTLQSIQVVLDLYAANTSMN